MDFIPIGDQVKCLMITTTKPLSHEISPILRPVCRNEYLYVVPIKPYNVMKKAIYLLVVAPIVNTALFIAIIELIF